MITISPTNQRCCKDHTCSANSQSYQVGFSSSIFTHLTLVIYLNLNKNIYKKLNYRKILDHMSCTTLSLSDYFNNLVFQKKEKKHHHL